MRIGVLASGDARDVRTWSGVPHFLTRELEQRELELHYFVPQRRKLLRVAHRLNGLSERAFARRFLPHHLGVLGRLWARDIEAWLQSEPLDLLLAINVDHLLVHLRTQLPIVHLSDATFAAIHDYYPNFSSLWGFAARAGHRTSRAALEHASVSVFFSRWARDSALRDYAADPARVHVVPFGANLDPEPSLEDIEVPEPGGPLELLFIGVDWERKGGPIALETLECLWKQGIECRLTVVGCRPPDAAQHPGLRVLPFLDKRDPGQLATYQQLWRDAAFFVLPSRQETFGAVFSEAAALGVPALAADTGGVADAIEDGVSGCLFPLEARGDAYAARIAELWANPDRYARLVEGARQRFATQLTWRAWADRVVPILEQAAREHGLADQEPEPR